MNQINIRQAELTKGITQCLMMKDEVNLKILREAYDECKKQGKKIQLKYDDAQKIR